MTVAGREPLLFNCNCHCEVTVVCVRLGRNIDWCGLSFFMTGMNRGPSLFSASVPYFPPYENRCLPLQGTFTVFITLRERTGLGPAAIVMTAYENHFSYPVGFDGN